MTLDIALMLLIIALGLVAFVRELFPIEVTALGLLAMVLLLGFVGPQEAFAGFSNKAVITIGALFILSHALMRTGILEAAADRLADRLRDRPWLALGGFLTFAAVMSGFLNNTAVVAMLIPVLMSLCRRFELSPSKVLIPLSYASILGGTLTLIGTSTNILVSAILEQVAQPPLGMFELTRLGAVYMVLGLLYVLLLAPRLLPARVDAKAMTRKYELGEYLTEVRVVAESKLMGTSCREAGLAERYGTTVVAVLRGERRHIANVGSLKLKEDDTLIVQASVQDLLRLRQEQGLALLPDIKLTDEELSSGGLKMAEALVPPLSPMIGRTLAEVNFRHRFGGFVLAIRRLGGTLREKLARARLEALDSLLMLIPEDHLEALRSSEDLVAVSEVGLHFRRSRLWWLVLVLLPAVVLAAAFELMEIEVGAVLAVVVLLVAGVMTTQQSYRVIDWSVLFMIAAFVPVGQAILNTGTADFLASILLHVGDRLPTQIAPYILVSLIYLVTSLLTQMISNNAAAIIVAPIALSIADSMGVDARPLIVAVCFAASAEFMTPMGYQTNLMVYGPGAYRFLDYTRFGAPLNLAFWLIATLLIPSFWSF